MAERPADGGGSERLALRAIPRAPVAERPTCGCVTATDLR